MKKIYLTFMLLLSIFALADKSDILTTFIIEERKEHGNNVLIEFKEELDGTISGYIIDLSNKEGQTIDTLNPDPELRGQSLIGMKFIKNFKYDESDDRYLEGKIYDPTRGVWWNARAYIDGNAIYMKGSLDKYGILGLTKVWKKYPKKSFSE